jgi:hypothetical protein
MQGAEGAKALNEVTFRHRIEASPQPLQAS